MNDILLGLVVVLFVLISLLFSFLVIVAVFMGFFWGEKDIRTILIMSILSIIVQVDVVAVVLIVSRLRIG